MANRSLVLAVVEEGVKVLSVPSGSIIHLTRPVSTRQFDRFDITNDAGAQKALLKSMTLSEIKALFGQMGIEEGNLPRRPKKDDLIDLFLRNLTGVRQEMDRATASGEAPVGGREVHIEVGANTSPEDIIRQLIANGVLPEGTVLPVEPNMTPTDVLEMVGHFRQTAQQNEPTTARETVPFVGQGYKLTADEPTKQKDDDETAELPQDLSLVVRGAAMSVVAQVSKLNTVKEALVRISHQLLKDGKDEYAALLNASVMNLVKMRTGEVMKDDAELCDYFDQPWGEVKMVMKDSSERSDVDKAFIASALLLDADVSKVSNNLHLNEKPTNSTGTLTIKVNDDIKMFYHYTSQDTVKDIHSLLEKLDINCDGEDADYRLKYVSSGSFLQAWEPVEATMKGSDICELTVALRGGGKRSPATKTVKNGHLLKKGILADLVKELKKKTTTANTDTMDKSKGIVEESLKLMDKLYNAGEQDAIKAFRIMLGKLNNETIGTDLETSPLMLALKNNKPTLRLNTLSDAVVKEIFGSLRDVLLEVEGVYESALLTFEIIATNAFYNEKSANWDWVGIRNAIKNEIDNRATTATSMSELTQALSDVNMD